MPYLSLLVSVINTLPLLLLLHGVSFGASWAGWYGTTYSENYLCVPYACCFSCLSSVIKLCFHWRVLLPSHFPSALPSCGKKIEICYSSGKRRRKGFCEVFFHLEGRDVTCRHFVWMRDNKGLNFFFSLWVLLVGS